MHRTREGELSVAEVDRNHVLRTDPAFQQQRRDRILDLLLNGALERTRAEYRIKTNLGDLRQRRFADLEPHVLCRQALLQALKLDPRNRLDVLRIQAMEHDDLVNAVDELG